VGCRLEHAEIFVRVLQRFGDDFCDRRVDLRQFRSLLLVFDSIVSGLFDQFLTRGCFLLSPYRDDKARLVMDHSSATEGK
jgi:hypothetical protein